MMNQYGYGESWIGHGLFGGVLMILFWAAVIYFIVWVVRRKGVSPYLDTLFAERYEAAYKNLMALRAQMPEESGD